MGNSKKDKKQRAFKIHAIALVIATALMTSAFAFLNMNSLLYQTSILTLPEHEPFNGTTYPVKKVPNWSKLTADERKFSFNELDDSKFIDIPYYDPKQLIISSDTLKWNNPVDDVVRNAKITYSTPYMGNYKLDGKENAGSHLAIDIKVPDGTPVYAIANGTVAKASTQTDGFGQHVVLRHNNFPNIDDPSKKEVLFSSYSHMSQVLVSAGEVVTKGQQIGLSGHSGTATTPHVHFQIDNAKATYHPFWPFTWSQASSAGLDFFSAVNAGLGKDLALETTVNPVVYVQKFLDAKAEKPVAVASAEKTVLDKPEVVAPVETVTVEPETSTSYVASSVETTVPVVEPEPTPEVKTPDTNPLDEVVSGKQIFTDIEISDKYFSATKYLSQKGVIKGYEDGSFKPDQPVNRAEALKFILKSIHTSLVRGDLPFKDVKSSEWYANYIYTAYKRNIVDGNPDGTFRPENGVNKAEFFKILFNGLSVDIDPVVSSAPYSDVLESDWYAPYISYAKELKILDPELTRIQPSKGMTRGEVADAMYRMMTISNDEKQQ